MTLKDLNASFVGARGHGVRNADGSEVPERHGVGVGFDCPCGCEQVCYVSFENPLDGLPPHDPRGPFWKREGETLETLTLTPSILRTKPYGCGWHGYITNGQIVNC